MAEPSKKRKIFDGRYEILNIVGRGSKSVVYHSQLASGSKEQVALKVLINTGDIRATRVRLRNEALCMVTAQHPYVLRLNDFHSVDELSYLSLEYAPFGDLRRYSQGLNWQNTNLPNSFAQVDKMFRQLTEALYYIHSVGIIHRDIKPDNILVINEDEVKLGDFGTAIIKGDDSTSAKEDLRSAVGTLNYLAPEVLKGEVYDHRADIYSLGLTFYEILLGRHPFESSPMAKQIDIRFQGLPELKELIPEISSTFSKIIHKCLSPDIETRYSSARDILRDLNSGTQISTSKTNQEAEKPVISSEEETPKINAHNEAERYPLTDKNLLESNNSTTKVDSTSESKDDDEYLINTQSTDIGTDIDDNDLDVELLDFSDSSEDNVATSMKKIEDTNNIQQKEPLQNPEEELAKTTILTDEDRQRIYSQTVKNNKSSLLKKALIACVLGFLAVLAMKALFFSNHTKEGLKTDPMSSIEPIDKNKVILPIFNSANITFPSMSEGMYSGTIKGLFSKSEIPLTFTTFQDGRTLVMLGLSGWTPTFATKDKGELRVASNGYVLRFSGEANSDSVFGTVTHVSTGRTANWSLSPVKSNRSAM